MPTISVIIPCLNEEKYLGLLLEDLAKQSVMPDEVIVADCDSTDNTVSVAKSYQRKLPIKIAHSPKQNPGSARNAGAQQASTDYLIFIDADMRIPKNTIEVIENSLNEKQVDFLTPSYKSDGLHPADRFLFWTVNRWMRKNISSGKLAAISGFMCVKRVVHNRLGGFNTKMAVGEDIDYVAKLRKHKLSYTYLDSLVIVNSSRRFEGRSLITALLQQLIQNSDLARWFFQPLLRKVGLQKKYGHYQ